MNGSLDDIRLKINAIDRDIASLFEQRMKQAAAVAEYKHSRGLPILDAKREAEVLQRNANYITDEKLRPYYTAFLKETMHQAREYEHAIIQAKETKEADTTSDKKSNPAPNPTPNPTTNTKSNTTPKHISNAAQTILHVSSCNDSYEVVIERGAIFHVSDYINLQRKILVVSDDGVPTDYWKNVLMQCGQGSSLVFPKGEQSKNMKVLASILSLMISRGFTRSDAVVAVGGGVVGDMAGFAASIYMRGIDFYNIPTTLLSQVDSSIGGKTAIDFDGVKNVVGAFHQPEKVIIDTDVLQTLDRRVFNEGMAEALKMAATFSRPLFNLIRDTENIDNDIDTIVTEALKLKKRIVEEDPFEQKLRRVLNFGHTVGHAIESAMGGALYHGECVGIGMLYFCQDNVREEIRQVLEKYQLPTSTDIDPDTLMDYIAHDKKKTAGGVDVVYVNDIGTFELKNADMAGLKKTIRLRQQTI